MRAYKRSRTTTRVDTQQADPVSEKHVAVEVVDDRPQAPRPDVDVVASLADAPASVRFIGIDLLPMSDGLHVRVTDYHAPETVVRWPVIEKMLKNIKLP